MIIVIIVTSMTSITISSITTITMNIIGLCTPEWPRCAVILGVEPLTLEL